MLFPLSRKPAAEKFGGFPEAVVNGQSLVLRELTPLQFVGPSLRKNHKKLDAKSQGGK